MLERARTYLESKLRALEDADQKVADTFLQAEKYRASTVAGLLSDMERKLNGNASVLDAYKSLGIEPPPTYSAPSAEVLQLAVQSDSGVLRLSTQREIARTGTSHDGSVATVEPNLRLRPYLVRGRLSRPGINEEVWRQEPVAFKSCNEVSALIQGATFEPEISADIDAESAELARMCHNKLQRMEGGLPRFQRDVSTLPRQGFATFEVVWHVADSADPLTYPTAMPFREQSTVERWLWDARGRNLEFIEYRSGGLSGETYVVPARQSKASQFRSLVVNVHASGQNLEGVSPIRVIVGLRKLKELILGSFGISYQKYSVPVALITEELLTVGGTLTSAAGSQKHSGEVQTLITRLQNLRSRLAAVLPVPAGIRVEYVNPTNDMPDPRPMLDYIDSMIALVFENQVSLLGSQSFGSYGMASVQQDKQFTASLLYADRVAIALTELLHATVLWNHSDPDSIVNLPRYTYRFKGTQNSSAWLADAAVLMGGAPVTSWPEAMQREAATKLGLAPETFE